MEGRRSLTGPSPPLGSPTRDRAPTVETILEDEDIAITMPQEGDNATSETLPGTTEAPTIPSSANLSQSTTAVQTELEGLRRWYQEAKEREEIQSLRLLKAQYEAGDRSMFAKSSATALAGNQPQASSASLPRPEPPQTYSKRGRAEYNRWERDCESFFLRSPANFTMEAQKVEFGLRYVSETLKTLWKSHCDANLYQLPLWTPTWANVKQVMLRALGTPAERQQSAFESLKRCRQRSNQSPTDLLDYMRPLWEELGASRTPEVQVLEYIAALLPQIQKDLFLLPVDRRDTLPQVEEHANVIYRRHSYSDRNNRPEKPKKQHRGQSGSEGESKTPKKFKKDNKRQFKPKRPKKDGDAPSTTFSCYGCGEAGHIRPNCPKAGDKATSQGSKPSNEAGKDKGYKN
jgi:hypothetical protein